MIDQTFFKIKNLQNNRTIFFQETISLFYFFIEFFKGEFKISLEKKNNELFFSFRLGKEEKEIKLSDEFYKDFFNIEIFESVSTLSNYCFLSFDISSNQKKYSFCLNEDISLDSKKETILAKKKENLFESITNYLEKEQIEEKNLNQLKSSIFVLSLFIQFLNILIEKKEIKINHQTCFEAINKRIEQLENSFWTLDLIKQQDLFFLNELSEKHQRMKEKKEKIENFKIKLKNFTFILVIVCILIFGLYKKKLIF